MRSNVGGAAPDFAIPATSGTVSSRRTRRLRDYGGRWLVLVFYPRDFSLVCPTELSALSARAGEFQALGADILSVSHDTLETHETWMATPLAEGGLGPVAFPLAADPDGVMLRAYGVYCESSGIALRGLYIIDPDGIVQYETVHTHNVARRPDETLRVLAALQTGGQCDANWCPGRPTLDVDALRPGQMASHYRIERPLGQGGFARVFLAHDTVLDRQVALKILRPREGRSAGEALREARLAAALNHPNVCTIFSVDDSEGLSIIVMECLPGQPLSKLAATGPLPAAHVVTIVSQIVDGMSAAHAQGIVHGDLKPANILVTDDGVVKILDFGIARRLRSLAPEAPEQASGDCSGSPRYMSPEQVVGRPAGAPADVFALGLLLCELLTGRPAIQGETLMAILGAIHTIDGEAMAGMLPPAFRSVVANSLARDPAARPSMRELSGLLRTLDV